MKFKLTKKVNLEICKGAYTQNILIYTWIEDDGLYVLKHWIHIPYTPHQAYINWIYPHLGKCHKDLRSKWYIGKAREDR